MRLQENVVRSPGGASLHLVAMRMRRTYAYTRVEQNYTLQGCVFDCAHTRIKTYTPGFRGYAA